MQGYPLNSVMICRIMLPFQRDSVKIMKQSCAKDLKLKNIPERGDTYFSGCVRSLIKNLVFASNPKRA